MKRCLASCRRIDKKNIKTIIYILYARLPSQHSDSFAALAGWRRKNTTKMCSSCCLRSRTYLCMKMLIFSFFPSPIQAKLTEFPCCWRKMQISWQAAAARLLRYSNLHKNVRVATLDKEKLVKGERIRCWREFFEGFHCSGNSPNRKFFSPGSIPCHFVLCHSRMTQSGEQKTELHLAYNPV